MIHNWLRVNGLSRLFGPASFPHTRVEAAPLAWTLRALQVHLTGLFGLQMVMPVDHLVR